MTEQKSGIQDADQLSGRDLQQSQATGGPGGALFTRDQMQEGAGGKQMGGGPSQSDMGAPGGSSGGGGYGNAQNQANHQGQQSAQQGYGSGEDVGHDADQDRAEAFDEQQGGGRGAESVSDDSVAQVGGSDGSFDQAENAHLDAQADELLQDQQQHQDRGQGSFERDADS
jgi:hypothetical protein